MRQEKGIIRPIDIIRVFAPGRRAVCTHARASGTRAVLVCAWLALPLSGCAIHYFDPKTGTEHLWGFGHMKMKIGLPNEGLQAVVRGTDVLGISVGSTDRQSYLTAGWHHLQRLDVVTESTAVRFEWPNSDFACVRVGSEFPPEFLTSSLACTGAQ